MGSRGPQPTPTAILEKRGSWRAKINPDEPMPSKSTPVAPDFVTDSALTLWNETVFELEAMGVLTQADKNLLARYCVLYDRWIQAERKIKARGMVYPVKGQDGNIIAVKEFPEVRIASNLSSQLLQMEREFGLSPASRTRIRTEKVIDAVKENSKEEDFFE